MPAVSRLGLPVDADCLLDRRGRPDCELVDGAACALLAGTRSYSGGHSILLQLAQVSPLPREPRIAKLSKLLLRSQPVKKWM